jgi:serine/threonine protein phosphatase PrpC
MKYQLGFHTLRGARPTNQDRIAYAERDNAVLMVLADGLGGHKGGDIAAEVLTNTVIRGYQNIKQPVISEPSVYLALSILQAHKAIIQYAEKLAPDMQPRTTCVLCLVQNGYAYWAHVGDSRLYHFRNNILLRRTYDHSTIEKLHREGVLSEDEMSTHPNKGRLLKCVGGHNEPTISLGEETRLLAGDTLLLCTDGLWAAFRPEELIPYLLYPSIDEGVEDMLHDAEEKMQQASDNLSAICLRWEDKAAHGQPLENSKATDVDHKTLWEKAKTKTLKQKVKEKAVKTNKKQRKDSIISEVKDLESYINKLNCKSD